MRSILAALILSIGLSSGVNAWPANAPLQNPSPFIIPLGAPTEQPAIGPTAPRPPKAIPASPKKVRAYRFDKSVNEESVADVRKFLEQAVKDKLDLVLIELDTPGGSYTDGHDMTRYIEVSPVPVVCVVDGRSASMGFYILQSCDRRIVTTRSLLMAHSAGLIVRSCEGTMLGEAALAQMLERIRVVNRAYAGQVALKMKLTADQYLAKIANGHEWWMNADEALRVGAVDAVWNGTPNTLFQLLLQGKSP